MTSYPDKKHDDSNPHEIISISFNIQGILHTRYYNLGKGNPGKYLVQTRSQAKSSCIKLPDIHGIGKGLDPNIHPEKAHFNAISSYKCKNVSQIKPRLGQWRAGLKHKNKATCIPADK